MKKLFLASAVSVLFAARPRSSPKPNPPRFDSRQDSRGVGDQRERVYRRDVHALGQESSSVLDPSFDLENNSFALRQFGLQVAKQPKEGFGGLVNITVGKDAQVIHSFPELASNGGSGLTAGGAMFDVTQASSSTLAGR